jgi:enoyl-CoA hydratase/carnithine racemase
MTEGNLAGALPLHRMTTRLETIDQTLMATGVLHVVLDRPAAANAINTQMGRDLLTVFSGLVSAPERARCVVISGAGTRAFCAGGDLKERMGMTDEQWQAQHKVFEDAFRAVIDCPIPVLAAVNGAAFGGGLELALACDIICAAETARFALTETTLGIIPGCGGTQNLPRAVGERRAKELIFTGAAFTAAQAAEWGLVNHVWPIDVLLAETMKIAERIAANAPLSMRQAKLSISRGLEMSLENGMLLEIQAYNRLVGTDDRREGIAAFNEKRKPNFKGR